ncbi:MAG TPA: gliding motility-associated ABC transporter substrate-binding protein GldG [Bacteroidia bacterium]|nr:gliding motility-associated ABC transporter substrate-binding protein GldG [Bacteroidia bacterium]
MSSTNRNKRTDLIGLGLGIAILMLLNVASQYVFARFDLTSEKRYTLTESTKEMLKKLDDIVYFKVYLDGDFPQGSGDYVHLRDETRIMLDEFRAYAGDKIQYEFIDPGKNKDKKERIKYQKQLIDEGMIPKSEPFVDDDGNQVSMLLFPWAVASYHQKQTLVPLLGFSTKKSDEESINKAVEELEYEMSNAIRKLQMQVKPKIAITQGHGEPDTTQLSDFVKGLREYYDVDFVNFQGNLNAFRDTMNTAEQIRNKYTAVIIDKPDSMFTPKELFILDQFILYGGKALFLVDPVYASIDSLAQTGMTMCLPRTLGLEDLTFRYGARMNSNVVEDLYCATVAIPVQGPQTQFMPAPWYYSPTILPTGQHPIVRNLDRIKFDFLSTVDTVETGTDVKKTILLTTSDKSRYLRAPARVGLRNAMIQRDPRSFDKPDQPVAVLLEGTFDSYFRNKFLPEELKNSKLIGYTDHSLHSSKIIVVGDGDVALNPVYKGKALPLGLDRMNRMNEEFYANKTFLLNCVNYLCDDKGLLSVRSREVTLRLLDRGKIREHKLKYQVMNTVYPVLGVMLFGIVLMWFRRRRYVQGKEPPEWLLKMGKYVLLLALYVVPLGILGVVMDNGMEFLFTALAVTVLLAAFYFVSYIRRNRMKGE